MTYERKNVTLSRVDISLEPNTLNCSITGLIAQTVYTIQVWAFTEVGAGPISTSDIMSGREPGKYWINSFI